MADAALDLLRRTARGEDFPTKVVARMRAEYEQRRRTAEQTHLPQRNDGFDAPAYRALRRRMQEAERAELLRLAEAGKICGDVMRHVQRQLDLCDLAHGMPIPCGVVAGHPLRTIEFGIARTGIRPRGESEWRTNQSPPRRSGITRHRVISRRLQRSWDRSRRP